MQADVAKDSITALQQVGAAYAWKLYVAHVATSLADVGRRAIEFK